MIKHGLGLLLALTLCGCAGERMINSSPFGGKEAAKVAEPIRNSVNVWPLAYQSGDNLSVLWPMYDQDPNGFSVRPLFVKDKDFYGIVPPICGCQNGKGWFLSLYNTDHNFGFAPVFNYGDQFNYYGPAWFKGDKFGFFPVFWAGKNYHTVPPLYYCQNGKGWFANVYNTESNFGMFPVFNHGKNFSYYGPVWLWDKQYGVFPVASLGDEYQAICPVVWGPDMVFFPGGYFSSKFNLLTLAWWEYLDGALNKWGFFPVVHWTPEFKNVLNYWQTKDNLGVFPLFMAGNDLNYATFAWWKGEEYGFFPFFWKGKDYNTLQPLYYYGWDKDATNLNLLWFLYHCKNLYRPDNGALKSTDNMFLLFGNYDRNVVNQTVDVGFWPLFDYSNLEYSENFMYLLGVSKNSFGVFAPFGFENNKCSTPGALPDWQYQNPLGSGFVNASKARIASEDNNLLLFLYRGTQSTYREWAPGQKTEQLKRLVKLLRDIPRVFNSDIAPEKRTSAQQQAFDDSTRKREQCLSEIRKLLKELGLPENAPFESDADRKALEAQLIPFTVEKQYSSYFTPLAWSSRYGNDQTAGALWPLFLYRKNGNKEVRGVFFCFTIDEQKPDALPTQNECSHPVDTDFGSADKAYIVSDKVNFLGFLFHHNLTTYREWDAAKQPDKFGQLLTQLRQITPIAGGDILESQRTEKQQQTYASSLKKRQTQFDKIRQLLKEIGLPENMPLETAEDRQAIEKQLIAFTVQKEYCSYFTPLFWSLRYGDDQKIAVLWPFFRYSKNGDRVDQSILQYFYRNQSDEKVSQTDVFPFVSVFANKDEYHFSWVWRLFRYERNLDQTKYWLFFIPLQ